MAATTASAPAAAFNPFIISTDVQKTDAKTRKLIRSHVMLGKNRGKRRASKPKTGREETNVTNETARSTSSSEDDVRPVVPVKVGNEFSLLKLAAAVEPLLIRQFLQCQWHVLENVHVLPFGANEHAVANQSKANMFPLSDCVAFTNHQRQWVMPVTYDPLFLYATVFASQAALGFGSSRDTHESTASHYFGKTVQMLRLRLEQDDQATATSDNTLMVIVILAMAALLTRQEETARSHLAGVKRIMELRGGFSSFDKAVKLLIEVMRCDIGVALSTGKPPLFFHRPFSGPHESLPRSSSTSSTSSKGEDFEILLPMLDASLCHVWGSLRDFCKTVNTASRTHRRLSEQAFLDNMASNVYPLLNLCFVSGTVSETCRLALLAFCSNAFLQWQGLNLNYQSLPSLYRQSLLGLAKSAETVPPQAMLWLLMMGGIALFSGEGDKAWHLPWLKETIEDCGVFEWEDVQDVLKRFVWVNHIHDRPGERVYAAAVARDVP